MENQSSWSAEIMTDPDRDHRLHVEFLEDDQYRGRIYQDDSGLVVIKMYDRPDTPLPADWLIGIIERYKRDIGAGGS